MKRIACGVLLLAIAGCGTSTVTAGHTSAPSSLASSAASPVPAHSASPVVIDGNITLASTGDPLGPFKITPLYCGKFTNAEQNQFGTTAAGGFIFRYANIKGEMTGSPNLTVNFLEGSTVVGSNVPGGSNEPNIGPGQNAETEVDAVGGSGQNLDFTRCEVGSYLVVTSQAQTLPGYWAP